MILDIERVDWWGGYVVWVDFVEDLRISLEAEINDLFLF